MRKRIFLMLIVIFALCPNLYAAPALQSFVDIEQPDGSILKARQQGDEFQHWTETKSGHTILRNPRTKYWDYAEQDANGKLKASGYRAMEQGLAPAHIPPRLKPPRNKALEEYKQKSLDKVYQERLQRAPSLFSSSPTTSVRRAPPIGDSASMPVTGERKLLVVRIRFNDRSTMVTTPDDLYKTVFSLSSTDNAVARYYAENSFSKLRVTPAEHNQLGSPEGIITVSIAANHPYPGGDNDPAESYASEPDIINLALAEAATVVGFNSFDINGDGTLEPSELTIYFIYAGYEAAGGGKTPSIWAHANGGSGVTTGEGGLNVNEWAISGELNNDNRQQGMGIIAHELGHTLCGLPDLYDPSGTNAGMGIFSLMAYGTWGAESGADYGTTPTNLDLWSREYIGWATPSEPVSGDRLSIYSSLFAEDSGYKLFNLLLSANEYYLLEYRRPSGWDLGAKSDKTLDADWQGGLLLTHIDTSVGSVVANNINDSSATGGRQRVSPVQANKERCDMASDFTCWGNRETLFYLGNNADWSSITTPSSNYYDGAATNFTLTAISAPGETITTDWSTTPIILLPVIDNFERSELTVTTALPVPLSWETSGIGNWTLTASGDNFGTAAEAPLSLSHNESATMETTVITGVGNLSFWYKVDSEIGDKLTFSIDGIQKRFWEGEVNWSRAFYPLTAGEHRLTWTYTKDTGDNPAITGFTGVDSAWIDDLSFAPGYKLNIAMEGVGLGNVAPDSGTVKWVGTTGAAFYNDGKPVTLTASAALNSLFTVWGGDCSGTATTCEITMDATKNVTATFIDSPPPKVTTGTASAISPSGATLNAIVNANNSAASDIRFEYGTTTSYGTIVAATPASVTGINSTAVSVTLPGLTTGTTYHFRVVANNGSGTSYGDNASFFVLLDQSIPAFTFSPLTLAVNGTTEASATAASGLAVILTSATPTVCTISGSTVLGVSAGTCTITANQPGDDTYIAAPPVSQDITVDKGDQSIGTISFLPASLAVNGTTTASATSGLAVTWSSSTPTVCTVSGTTVTGLTAGTCTIAANQVGNANYNAATQVTQNITVAKADQTIGTITFLPASLGVNGTTVASATATSGLAAVLTSTTPTVCTISGSTVTGIAAGTCTIAANQVGNVNYNAATQVAQNITVAKADQTIGTITFLPASLGVNGTTVASATATSGLAAVLTSTTPTVCTISGSTVTGIAAGTCTIAANQVGNVNYNAATQVAQNITVAKADQTIGTITFLPASLGVNGTTVASATATSGLAAVLTSTTPTVCTISGSTVTGIAAGTCTIAANQVGNVNYNAATQVAQNITVAKADQTIGAFTFTPTTLAVNDTTEASATATSELGVTLSSTTPAACTISGTTVTGLTAGTCTIAANQVGNVNYNAATQVTQDITVAKATPIITWATPTDIVYGTALSATQLNADANGVNGTLLYTPLAGTVLNVGTSSLTATFIPTDNANYSTPSPVTVTINVAAAGQTITFGTAPALTYGGANASVSANGGASGQPVTFSSLTSDVCSISGTTVTPIAAGTCKIEANQVGNVNYNAAPPVIQILTVATASPVITWTTPVDIVYGTALSATQLNADANGVNGTLLYTPLAGTVLNVGTSSLTATFTPTDNANYSTPSPVTVTINVAAAGQTITFGTAPALTYGGANASVSATGGASGQPVTFSSLTSDVCSISGTTVTPIAAGTCKIEANQVGNVNYNAAPPVTQSTTVGKVYGDIDNNGFTEAADALLALQIAIGKTTVNDVLLLIADVAPLKDGVPNPDGKVTAADAWLILRKSVGL